VLKGSVTGPLGPLTPNSVLEGDDFVNVPAEAQVEIRHRRSGRTFRVLGPARVLPCHAGEESLWLAYGSVETEANQGARPGADVWLATPYGTVRYADARLHIADEQDRLSIRVLSGVATWVPTSEKEVRLSDPKAPLSVPKGEVSAVNVSESCVQKAEEAAAIAQSIRAAKKVGEAAGAHVRARRSARHACAIAEATVGGLDPSSEQARRLGADLSKAERRWRAVP
jgi:hypothetical protein